MANKSKKTEAELAQAREERAEKWQSETLPSIKIELGRMYKAAFPNLDGTDLARLRSITLAFIDRKFRPVKKQTVDLSADPLAEFETE